MFRIKTDQIMENYKSYAELGRVFYPVKANSNENILKLLYKTVFNEESKFFISTREHFETLYEKLGVSADKIALMNPLVDEQFYVYLYMKGVRFFVFDDIGKLENLLLYADISELELCFRINTMEAYPDVITNLGATVGEVRQMMQKCSGAKKIGVSFYLNPEVKRKSYTCLTDMLQIVPKNIQFLSVGGIPAFEKNKAVLADYKEHYDVELILEPGRGLLEDTMDLETSVIKRTGNIITIKHGIYSGFLDILLYNKQFELSFIVDGNKVPLYIKNSGDREKIYLFGGSADSADKLGVWYVDKEYYDKITTKTKVLIQNVGTYFEEFTMRYGRNIEMYEA